MEAVLAYGFVAVILSAAVQFVKKQAMARSINPLLILAGISVVGGVIYAVLQGAGVWDVIVKQSTVAAAAANLLYNIFSQAKKALDGPSA